MKLPVASFTFLNTWSICPYQTFRKYIKKDLPRQPQSEAMLWGNNVHSAFEARIKHETKFPAGMEKFETIAAPLVAAHAVAEKALGIDAEGNACDFFDKNVWLRGKIDATVIRQPHAAIFDFKTGAKREHRDELQIHGLLLKAWLPTIQTVTAHFVWLKDGLEVGRAFDVSDTDKTMAEVRSTMNTVANCMEVEDFPKRRNPLCGWCDVLDCENNTKGR